MQIVLYNSGITISQKDIFEKYIEYNTPDEWYEENGIKYYPQVKTYVFGLSITF